MTSIDNAAINTAQRAASEEGIIIQAHNETTLAALERLEIPAVNVGSCISEQVPTVQSDPSALGQLAAEHLHDRGFRRFADGRDLR